MSLLQLITDYDKRQEERIRLLKEEVDRLEKKNDELESSLAATTLAMEEYCRIRDGVTKTDPSRPLWDEDLARYGGKFQRPRSRGEVEEFFTYDGETFAYRSVWDSDEDIDKFIDSFPDGCIEGDRTFIDGYLTYFFTVSVKRD